jgi:hypothetical protein
MSLSYIDSNGNEKAISGLNGLSGEMVMGASTIRTGTISLPAQNAGSYIEITVTFSSPMPDANYICEVNYGAEGSAYQSYMIKGKTKNGFNVIISTHTAAQGARTLNYYAAKLFSVEGLEDIENDINTLKNVTSTVYTVTYGTNVSAINDTDQVRTMVYNNGLKEIVGAFKIDSTKSIGSTIITVNNNAQRNISLSPMQKWFKAINCITGLSYTLLMNTNIITNWGSEMPVGTYMIHELYY